MGGSGKTIASASVGLPSSVATKPTWHRVTFGWLLP